MAGAPSEDEYGFSFPRFQVQRINYSIDEAPATMTIDTARSYVDYVLSNEQAMQDCIGMTDAYGHVIIGTKVMRPMDRHASIERVLR